jgi:F0F1-type ATP synthase assembly protein I
VTAFGLTPGASAWYERATFSSLSALFKENANTDPTRPRDPSRPGPLFRALRVSSLGLEMAVATAIGWGVGTWLDRVLDTGPWLMLGSVLLGVAAGFLGLFRAARTIAADARAETSP